LNQDTFYWGTLKGVGKVYVQVVVDTFCSLGFAIQDIPLAKGIRRRQVIRAAGSKRLVCPVPP